MRNCRAIGRSAVVAIMCLAALASSSKEGYGQTLPSAWASRDIGGVALAGSADYKRGTFTITASGADIWGRSDRFRFVYQRVSGDVDVIARVDSVLQADVWSKAGVMIRASLAADSAHALTLVSAAKGMAFQRRPATGTLSVSTAGPTAAAPRWVRVTRLGTTVHSYASKDGFVWKEVGSDTISLQATAYVGLAVTSHDAGTLTTATASHVAVVPLSVPPAQKAIDIGAPALESSVTHSNGIYDVHAAGLDIWGTSDQFNYIYQPISGDFEVSVRVDSLGKASGWSKTGVMVRETLAARARQASALVSAANGFVFQRRIDPGGYSVSTTGGPTAFPGWVKLVRRGDVFEAFRSADGVKWAAMGSDAIPMQDAVYVGIATTSHNDTLRTEAVLRNFSVVRHDPTGNQPPTVALTAPLDGAVFATGTNVTLAASARDADGTIARVDFFAGTQLIGSDSDAPYTTTWRSAPAGTYKVRAVAYDDAGASGSSGSITITVESPTSGPPTGVTFHKSADHDTLVIGYELRIFASGADPDRAAPLVRSRMGKPVPDANGNITVDESSFFRSLPAGSYIATVAAIGARGSSQSAGVPFTM